MGQAVKVMPCCCVEQVVPVDGKRERVCLTMGMGSGGIKGPESARALFRCGVYQTSGLGRGSVHFAEMAVVFAMARRNCHNTASRGWRDWQITEERQAEM